jgi:hypothetical protein
MVEISWADEIMSIRFPRTGVAIPAIRNATAFPTGFFELMEKNMQTRSEIISMEKITDKAILILYPPLSKIA